MTFEAAELPALQLQTFGVEKMRRARLGARLLASLLVVASERFSEAINNFAS
jgi:hypothetical protein